ncbi:hypothetical protein [Achromobacter aloeverae]
MSKKTNLREKPGARPVWEADDGTHRLVSGRNIVGRVDYVAGMGYWWQIATASGVERNLFDAQRCVEYELGLEQLSTFDARYWARVSQSHPRPLSAAAA